MMNTLIVRLDGNGIDNLKIVGDANALRAAAWIREQTIVIAATATNAESVTSECESGNENDVESGDFDGIALRFRFPNVHLAALKVLHAVDLPGVQFPGLDLKGYQAGSLRIQCGEKMGKEVGFVFEPAENGNLDWRDPLGSAGAQAPVG